VRHDIAVRVSPPPCIKRNAGLHHEDCARASFRPTLTRRSGLPTVLLGIWLLT
jgi:hypothetical protein